MTVPTTYGIRFTRGCRAGETHRLAEGDTFMGRSITNHLVLPDILVSRTHACLRVRDAGVVIEDRNSRAGIRVNGHRIDRPVSLRPGDTIRMGNQEMEILSVDAIPNPERGGQSVADALPDAAV